MRNLLFDMRFGLMICSMLLALTVLFAGVVRGQANTSVYTSLEVKKCRTLKSSDAGAGDYEGKCPGVSGYTLLLVEGDLRQNLTIVTPRGMKHSLDLWQVISGGFSSVGPRAEWRMRKQGGQLRPIAIIVRFNANEDPGDPDKITSYLAVAKITASEICVIAKIPPGPGANTQAREVADISANKPCMKLPQ